MPTMFLIGGPNGAGKTSSAMKLIPGLGQDMVFVNADIIATGLSAFDPESVAMEAGRIMLERLRSLARQKLDFAFESTLAARTFATFASEHKKGGYRIHVLYIWLSSPDLASKRVAERVARGGHFVEPEVVRRRYKRGVYNFFNLYMPIADEWFLYDNSSLSPNLVAEGGSERDTIAYNEVQWMYIQETAR